MFNTIFNSFGLPNGNVSLKPYEPHAIDYRRFVDVILPKRVFDVPASVIRLNEFKQLGISSDRIMSAYLRDDRLSVDPAQFFSAQAEYGLTKAFFKEVRIPALSEISGLGCSARLLEEHANPGTHLPGRKESKPMSKMGDSECAAIMATADDDGTSAEEVRDAVISGQPLLPPIVLLDSAGSRYLLSGDSTLAACLCLGYLPNVNFVRVSCEFTELLARFDASRLLGLIDTARQHA